MVPVSRLLHPIEEESDWYKIVLKDIGKDTRSKKSGGVPDYQKGLFGFQSHRRFNYLKPPKPPLIKNIEYRSPTIWLPQDDKYLIHYVAEFCFNWELISEHLSSSASTLNKYESNIERRTPWQCFERYIQLNEKFQFSDMKGVYSYHAQQWLEQAHRAQSTTKRRISPLGVGNESIQRGHRRLRWASMFDAMRKCMKKREIAASKIPPKSSSTTNGSTQTTGSTSTNSETSSSSDIGVNGSSTSGSQAKRPADKIPTPAELSKLKFERDKSIQEAYLNQQATRSRMIAAVAQQKQQQNQNNTGSRSQSSLAPSQAPSSGNIPPQQRVPQGTAVNSLAAGNKATGVSTGMVNNQLHVQQQQHIPALGGPAGMTKRPTTPNGTPYTNEQIQQILQIQKQRRLMQQQNQNIKGAVSPMGNNGAIMQNMPSNKQMVGGISGTNGVPGSSMPIQRTQSSQQGSLVQSQAQSSQSGQLPKSKIHFAPAQVSAIINSIQTKNPGLSKEQVTKLAATYLANIQQQQQNKLTQQQPQPMSSGSGQINPAQRVDQPQAPVHHKQPQIATLTPQERNQLQMLKAAKTAQQQQLQLQQQQLHQQQLQQQQQQQGKSGLPMLGVSPLDPNNLSKLEYEQRKKLLIQKHQQQQQRLAANNNTNKAGNNISEQGSPFTSSPSSQSPSISSSSQGNINSNPSNPNN